MVKAKTHFLWLLLLLLPVVLVVAVGTGSVYLSPAEILGIIRSFFSGRDSQDFGTHSFILLNLRLPRALLAALVGSALSGAGVGFQAFFRNPLADPYVVGVSAGAALGATVSIGFGLQAVGLFSFFGALAVSYLVYRIAGGQGSFSSMILLLAGMSVSAFLSAFISLIMVVKSNNLAQTVFWLMGGFAGRGWNDLLAALPLAFLGFAGLWRMRKELNLLLLPEDEARSLGLAVVKSRRWLLFLGSLIAAAAVSVSGLIGFVGLVVPHLVRLLVGPDHRYLLPGSLLLGALLMILADLAARSFFAPLELPVGAITALFGAPFFIYLLIQAKKEGRSY